MIAVDTNVLVYAHREELAKHEPAKRRLTELAEGAERWAIPVFCLGEFIRVITHPRLFDPPYTAEESRTALRRVLDSPSLRVLYPRHGFARLLTRAVVEADAIGNLVFDAQIVALCRQAGVSRLMTEDRDFDRFGGLATIRIGS